MVLPRENCNFDVSVGLYGNIRDLAWYIRRAVVHIQLQPVSPGIWHVVSQRSQPDSPSDSWRITVIACLWSLTSSWSHNYRMASRSINERHRRCCTRRAPFYALVRVRTCAYLYRAGYIRTSRALFLSSCLANSSFGWKGFEQLNQYSFLCTIYLHSIQLYIFFVVSDFNRKYQQLLQTVCWNDFSECFWTKQICLFFWENKNSSIAKLCETLNK